MNMNLITSISLGVAAIVAAGLVMKYGADLPIVKQAKQGFQE